MSYACCGLEFSSLENLSTHREQKHGLKCLSTKDRAELHGLLERRDQLHRDSAWTCSRVGRENEAVDVDVMRNFVRQISDISSRIRQLMPEPVLPGGEGK